MPRNECVRHAWSRILTLLVAVIGCVVAGRAGELVANAPQRLVWDALERVLEPKPGERLIAFQFTVTNVSSGPVAIQEIRPTCDCTIAGMPDTPWVIPSGGSGSFAGTFDIGGYHGTVSKALIVSSDAGAQTLTVTVKVPPPDEATRKQNQAIASADRQAVFRGDCAKCHVAPAKGRMGSELFTSACGVCHLSKHRAGTVPNLLVARQRRDAEFWRNWIAKGKPGTMMPAWAKDHGGPLTDEQIESLVAFALEKLPTEPR